MYVADLRHFLDLSPSTPGPARRMAEQLGGIVRAASAGDAGIAWTSALPCRRRPARRPCPGRITVFRPEPPAEIRWECGVCGDQGVISGWEDSPYDLRRRGLALAGSLHDVVLSHDMAAALRELRLLDADCERLVYRIRADGGEAVLSATGDDLDELAGAAAAESNYEPNRRRQRRLDTVYDALGDELPSRNLLVAHPSVTDSRVHTT
jgi:hypothetical protein